MKYSITRKINLGRYGLDYESLDISVIEAESWAEAEQAIQDEHKKIHKILVPELNKRLEKLNMKVKLTFKEEQERELLQNATNLPPF